jgi:hypothetical protein
MSETDLSIRKEHHMKLVAGSCCRATIMALLVASSIVRASLVSPDGKLVVYTVPTFDEDGSPCTELCLLASGAAYPKALGRVPGQRDRVSWIGNDRICMTESSTSGSIAIMGVGGKQLPDIVLPPECRVLYLAVSPDGQKVAFTGSRKSGEKIQYGLFVYDIERREVKLLIEKGLKTCAAWSPDSRKLAIGAGEGYRKDHPLMIADVLSGQVEDTGVMGVGTSWSPDGKSIACTTDIQRGGSYFAGVPTDGKLGIYSVAQRQMRVIQGTDGALAPIWSQSGAWLAYVTGGKIGIAAADGSTKAVTPPSIGERIKASTQMGWAGDQALYIRGERSLARFDVEEAKTTTVAQWEEPTPPALKPADFKLVELPRVTVKYARFDRAYAEAFGRILQEALKVYESHGFKMPQKVTLEARIDPSSTALWTDGDSQMFLHLKSKQLLAPASQTGVYNIYGMCHELGHIAMYRNLSSLMGLPQGVPEGWADYAGKVVVTEVAANLGKSIWPEYYDIAEVEGIGRFKRESAQAKDWDEMDPVRRASLVFYRIELECGRDKLATAMAAALAERPNGKALMPLMLAKLRAATANATAANWVPESVLVPQVNWQTKERHPGEDFFADQKVEKDGDGLWLFYDGGTMSDKLSISGSAQTVLFRLPAGQWQLNGMKLFGARYGMDEPPKEDISFYICDEAFNLLREVKVPYSNFEKGDEKWQAVSFPPVELPGTFYLGVDFHATAQKGVYVGMDKSVRRSHSRFSMPYDQVSDMKTTADWMIRAHLQPRSH